MRRHLTYIILIISVICCGVTFNISKKVKSGEIKIKWVDNLTGDFSFIENWDYPESIIKNEFGQLSCDGNCPPEIQRMKDENGRIYEDSLEAFYQLVDTTHQFHSIKSEAQTYEWAGTDFVTVTKINADTTICFTHCNVGTHSSLILTITKEMCIPIIELNSIFSSAGIQRFQCNSGQIEIDKNLWEKGILKANFNLTFDHKENPNMEMFWKGKIYKRIESK